MNRSSKIVLASNSNKSRRICLKSRRSAVITVSDYWRKKQYLVGLLKFMIILAIVATSMLSLGIPAYAHKPLEAENNNKLENSLQIPNPRVSWVIYKQIQAGDVNYYRFNASTGDRFYAEMDIPK